MSGILNPTKKVIEPKHIENFHFVDHCTRNDRITADKPMDLKVPDRITLKKYSVVVQPGSSYDLEITGLPQGYSRMDLVFASDDRECADVDGNGCVHGNASGSAVITISTSDGKHSIHCNILIPQVRT